MTKQILPVFRLLAAVFFTLSLLVVSPTYACPPPIEITINCPSGDCEVGDIIITTGNDNEVNTEEGKGRLEEIIDDILDFFKDIFKKKDNDKDGSEEGDGGGDSSGSGGDSGNGTGSGDSGSSSGGGTPSGGSSGSGDAQSASTPVEQRLEEIAAQYFKGGKVTAEGIILQYDTQPACPCNFTMSYNFDIPIPQKWLKKHHISGPKKLKAGKYSAKANGRLFLPFKSS